MDKNEIKKMYNDTFNEFCLKYNKNLNLNNREKLNLLLSPSMFWAKNDYFLSQINTFSFNTKFAASTFKFVENEINIFLKYTDGHPYAQRAKERFTIFEKFIYFSRFTYFKSIMDIIRIENLDVPICIITCNVNETIDISRFSLEASLYIFFDGYEKIFLNEDDFNITKGFFKKIKKINSPYDPALISLKQSSTKKTNIKKGEKLIVDGIKKVIGEQLQIIWEMEGGESIFFKSDANNDIVKLFNLISDTKIEKIKLLVRSEVKERIFSFFCELPDKIVLSENKKIIGFTMKYVEGERLDRFVHVLSQKKNVNIVQIINLFLQISLAVRSVHLSDFVIGDLHYSNFIVTKDGKIKIIDCDSFQVIKYPCDGFHPEAQELEGKFLSCQDDFYLLKIMFDFLMENFKEQKTIYNEYKMILKTYKKYINSISGFIYSFYYYLHSIEDYKNEV